MGKLGILWELDAETGDYRNATDLGYQNVVDPDPHTGRLEYRPDMIPELDVEIDFCPSAMHRTRRILWRHRQRTPFNSAALTTAGGLVFIGDWNRYANAYDEAPASCCGRRGCPRRCRNFRSAMPSTAGSTWPSRSVSGPLAWSTIPLRLTPEMRRPETGNGIYVFALPQ